MKDILSVPFAEVVSVMGVGLLSLAIFLAFDATRSVLKTQEDERAAAEFFNNMNRRRV